MSKPLAMVATLALMLTGMAIGLIGLLASSEATFGTSLVGFACLLGIMARIFQAAYLAMPEPERQAHA